MILRWTPLLLAAGLLAQVPTPAPASPTSKPTFQSGVSEVVIDVVVRDKKGRAVRNLTRKDFQIFEDGVEQPLTGARLVGVQESTAAAPAGTQPQSDVLSTPADMRVTRVISMVFDRVGRADQAYKLAREGASHVLAGDPSARSYYGVFAVDQKLWVLQNYTNDRDLAKKAVEKATSSNPSDFTNDMQGLNAAAAITSGANGTVTPATGGTGAPGVDAGGMSDAQAARVIAAMNAFSQEAAREQVRRSSLYSLWSIIEAQKSLPGRKTILYFTTGMQVPNTLDHALRGLINAANQSNVAVYMIDTRGLTGELQTGIATGMLNSAAGWTARARNTENVAVERGEVAAFDQMQDSFRAQPQQAMNEIAVSTGGRLLANTNDFRPLLDQVATDIATNYELTYMRPSSIYDGRFHPVEVRVPKQKDLTVQARNGYYALPVFEGKIVYPFDGPLLKALGDKPLPRAFPHVSQVTRFAPGERDYLASLMIDVPLSEIKFTPVLDPKTGKVDNKGARVHITVMSLLKDSTGNVVDKFSRRFGPLHASLTQKQGRFILTHPLRVAPGRYTLETSVQDVESVKFSARRAVVVVPPVTKLRLSEPVLVRRTEAVQGDPEADDPLVMGAQRVVPALVDSLKGGKSAQIPLYFLAYSAVGAKPKVLVDVLKEEKMIARHAPGADAADSAGRTAFLLNLPAENLSPGQYEVRITATHDQLAAQERLFVTIE